MGEITGKKPLKVVVAKSVEEHGLSLDSVIAALTHIKNDLRGNPSEYLTVVAVGKDTCWSVNEISYDGDFVRIGFDHAEPAVHPDK